jgi:hypothetical protein
VRLLVESLVVPDVKVARVTALRRTGGIGSSNSPRKKATLTYFVKQWKLRNQPSPSIP